MIKYQIAGSYSMWVWLFKAYTSNVKKGKSKTVWWVIFRNGLNEVPNELVDNSRWGGVGGC